MIAADPRTVRARIAQRHRAALPKADEGGAILERWREPEVLGGRRCCGKAARISEEHPKYRACVCAWLENCPDHGLTHVGTHD